ncbi:MAG: tetratricopeptide repeat protein [Verrucomicrobia bacterium]|nr:tetratricopeptide repeat protein [Verrucomicrobiota bacterium]
MKIISSIKTPLLLCAAILLFNAHLSFAANELEELAAKAEAGDVGAQYEMGQIYDQGLKVQMNEELAFKWYLKAAQQGHMEAQFTVGGFFFYGRGGQVRDQSLAVEWYKAAAQRDHAKAQFEMGRCFWRGLGVEKNEGEAIGWLEKAASQGMSGAMFSLSQIYLKGDPSLRDASKAIKWYMETARAGDPYAQFLVGECYASGEGMEKNLPEAKRWYQKAAEMDFKEAQVNLGECYANGYGVEPDILEAYAWYTIAMPIPPMTPDPAITVALNALKGQMTTAQIAQADKRAEACRKKFGFGEKKMLDAPPKLPAR